MELKAEQPRSFSRRKRLLIAVNVVMMIGIAAAIFLGVCFLASRPELRTRIDLTKERSYTLSPLTLDLLQALDRDIDIISIFHQPYPLNMDPTGRSIVEKQVGNYANLLLQEYVVQGNGRIRLEVLDRFRDNLRVSELYEEIGLSSDNVVVFLCRGPDGRPVNRKDIYPDDLAVIDAGGVDPATNVLHQASVEAYNVEAAVTSAILSVMEEVKPKACITTGRGEANPEVSAPEGISASAEALRHGNFEVEPLALYSDPRVPEDCTVLVIAGPEEDFSAEEVAAVRAYLHSGGRLFMALSPSSTRSLEGILEDFDIGLNRAVTCREKSVSHEDRHLKAVIEAEGFSEESRITRALAKSGGFVNFRNAGAVNRRADDLDVIPLVWTAQNSWGDIAPEGGKGNYYYDSDAEEMGSRLIGAACQGKEIAEGAKLVFFADTFFYSNLAVHYNRNNFLLFMNALNWLAEREFLLDIPPRTPYASSVDLTPEEYNDILFYVVVVIPAAAVLLGAVVWRLRRG